MTFRAFIQLFKDCDHSWGQLARYASEQEGWHGDDALSLFIFLESHTARLICHEMKVAYSIYQKPLGLEMDYSAELAQG